MWCVGHFEGTDRHGGSFLSTCTGDIQGTWEGLVCGTWLKMEPDDRSHCIIVTLAVSRGTRNTDSFLEPSVGAISTNQGHADGTVLSQTLVVFLRT